MTGRFKHAREGYLRIRLTGGGTERFLNLCCANRLDPWDLRVCRSGVDCFMALPDFRRIRPLARKAGVRVRILKRYGFPFFIYRNRRRKGLVLGCAACFLLLYMFSLFIWNITFEGNSHYSRDTLLAFLESQNVRCGMRRDQVSCADLEESIRNAFPEIIWVSASVTGTRLTVRIRENEALSSVPVKDESPCELAAAKDGVITRMIVRQGRAAAAIGDTVTEGQLLVSAELSLMDDNGEVVRTRYVHADADVYARTAYSYRVMIPKLKSVHVPTGRVRRSLRISAGTFRAELNLPARGEFAEGLKNGAVSFGSWLLEKIGAAGYAAALRSSAKDPENGSVSWYASAENHQFRVFGDFYLPVYWEEKTALEARSYERPYTEEELDALAKQINRQYLENLLEKGVHIIENDVKILEYGLSYIVEGTVTAEEEIAAEREVSVSDMPGEEMMEDR